MSHLAIAALLFASVAVTTAQSPAPSPADTPQLEAFLARLQRASQIDDRDAIAAMIRYPITISIGGFRVPVADVVSFLTRYDDIFNPPLREAIARATVLPVELVVMSVDGQLRITSITVPDPAGAGATAIAPAAGAPGGAARKQEPRRIAIRVGPRPTQIPGLLARGGLDTFILYLPKGQLAGVRLERVRAGAAALRVVHARTGAPLGARTSADGRFVSGRPTEGADYRIEVRRSANGDDAPLPYMLSLSLR